MDLSHSQPVKWKTENTQAGRESSDGCDDWHTEPSNESKGDERDNDIKLKSFCSSQRNDWQLKGVHFQNTEISNSIFLKANNLANKQDNGSGKSFSSKEDLRIANKYKKNKKLYIINH